MDRSPDALATRSPWMTLLVAGALLVAGGMIASFLPHLAEAAWLAAAISLALGTGRTGSPVVRPVLGRLALFAVPAATIVTGWTLNRTPLELFAAARMAGGGEPDPELIRLWGIAGTGAGIAVVAAVIAAALIVRTGEIPGGWGWLAAPVLIGGALCSIIRDLERASLGVGVRAAGAELDAFLLLVQIIGSVAVGGVLILFGVVSRSQLLAALLRDGPRSPARAAARADGGPLGSDDPRGPEPISG